MARILSFVPLCAAVVLLLLSGASASIFTDPSLSYCKCALRVPCPGSTLSSGARADDERCCSMRQQVYASPTLRSYRCTDPKIQQNRVYHARGNSASIRNWLYVKAPKYRNWTRTWGRVPRATSKRGALVSTVASRNIGCRTECRSER